MQLDLRLIEAFTLVLRSGSLTRAEAVSGISKATLSRQVLALEQALGSTLLTRRARGVVPTETGRVFLAHCEALLADVSGRLESARVQVQEMGSGISGGLSVMSDNEFSTTFVCHVTRLFLERYPNVKCRMDIAGRADSPSIEEVDCYVCAAPPDIPNLIGRLLGRVSYGLYASPSYLRRKGIPLTPNDLDRYDSIVLSEKATHPSPAVLHSNQHSQPYVPKSVIETNDYWVMKTFCLDGFGIALLPDFFARPEVSRNILEPVLPNWKPERTRIYCAYQRQRYAGRKLKEFIELMIESVKNIDTYNLYVGATPDQSKQS